MTTVAVTRAIPDIAYQVLREAFGAANVRIWDDDSPPDPRQMLDLLQGCAGALIMVTDQITADLLDQLPELKAISSFSVGFDHIDVAAATARDVAICNTPGVLTETTADATFALMMAAARRIPEGIDYVRTGQWTVWKPMVLLGGDLHRATLGIIGLGRIGQAVARRARGFEMRLLYHSTLRYPELERDLGVTHASLDDLLRESDFVTIHAALTDRTRGMISTRELEMMKSSAILINAARGPIVDTGALVTALREGQIGGAALDVTDPEPLPADHPLLTLPNCIVVPHTGSSTVATRHRMAELSARNLRAVLQGERPAAIVNPEVLGRHDHAEQPR